MSSTSTITIRDLVRSDTAATIIVAAGPGAVGPQGPQGPPGPSGPMQIVRSAAADVGGHRMVRLNSDGNAVYADCETLADASAVLGMTIGAVGQGDDATIQTEGELIEPTWNWDPDLPIFLGTSGQLTQSPPTTGFILCVAVPTGTDRVFIRIGPPILAAE